MEKHTRGEVGGGFRCFTAGTRTLGSAVGSAGGSSEHSKRREAFATSSEVILVLAAAQGISKKGLSWFQVEMQPAEGCWSDAKARAAFVHLIHNVECPTNPAPCGCFLDVNLQNNSRLGVVPKDQLQARVSCTRSFPASSPGPGITKLALFGGHSSLLKAPRSGSG